MTSMAQPLAGNRALTFTLIAVLAGAVVGIAVGAVSLYGYTQGDRAPEYLTWANKTLVAWSVLLIVVIPVLAAIAGLILTRRLPETVQVSTSAAALTLRALHRLRWLLAALTALTPLAAVALATSYLGVALSDSIESPYERAELSPESIRTIVLTSGLVAIILWSFGIIETWVGVICARQIRNRVAAAIVTCIAAFGMSVGVAAIYFMFGMLLLIGNIQRASGISADVGSAPLFGAAALAIVFVSAAGWIVWAGARQQPPEPSEFPPEVPQ